MAERPAVNRKAAGSTPVPAIIAEWSDGQGGTLIRCDMPVRIRLLQRSVLRGHCSDEKMSFTMAMSVEAPANLAKEKDDHALRDDLQTA